MKNLLLILIPLSLFLTPALAQVQLDKPLQLTGSGLDARVMGIDTAVLSTDAVNLGMLQSAVARYGEATGSNGTFIISLWPWSTPIAGTMVSFRANHTHTAAESNTTLVINGISYDVIYNFITQNPSAMRSIDVGSIVTVIYNGTEFQFMF